MTKHTVGLHLTLVTFLADVDVKCAPPARRHGDEGRKQGGRGRRAAPSHSSNEAIIKEDEKKLQKKEAS